MTETCLNIVDWLKSWFVPKSSLIISNTDLNNMKTEGFYHCKNETGVSEVSTISNVPSGLNRAFSLLVEKNDAYSNGVKQTLTDYYNNRTWIRTVWTASDVVKTTDWIVVAYDTDWAEVEYSTGYTRYDTGVGVMYRRRGNVVEIAGNWKPTANKSASDEQITFATLPSGFRPSHIIRLRMQSSGLNTYLLTINTNGTMQWSRYGTSSSSQMPSTAWNNAYVTFSI